MSTRADCVRPGRALIQSSVTAEDADGHDEEALFSEETLPRVERWAVELVTANFEHGCRQSGVDEFAADFIAEASASYLPRYGRTLAVVHLAVYASSDELVPSVRGCMVIGFTSSGLQRLSFYRPSNHAIHIDDPECSLQMDHVFGN